MSARSWATACSRRAPHLSCSLPPGCLPNRPPRGQGNRKRREGRPRGLLCGAVLLSIGCEGSPRQPICLVGASACQVAGSTAFASQLLTLVKRGTFATLVGMVTVSSAAVFALSFTTSILAWAMSGVSGSACRGRSKIRPPGRRGSVAANADHGTTRLAVRVSLLTTFAPPGPQPTAAAVA